MGGKAGTEVEVVILIVTFTAVSCHARRVIKVGIYICIQAEAIQHERFGREIINYV